MKSEVTKGRIDHSKKWKDQAGVGEPGSIISKSLYQYAALNECTNFRHVEKLIIIMMMIIINMRILAYQ